MGMCDGPVEPGEPAWVSTTRDRVVVVVLALVTAASWGALGARLSPAAAVGLTVGLAFAWSVLAWGPGRLPELTLWWMAAAVLAAYALALLPQSLRPAIAVLVLLGPPVGYLLSGRSRRPARARTRLRAVAVVAIVPTLTGALVSVLPTVSIVHALGWGYDNAAHVANLGAFLRHGTFFFLDDTFRESTFSFYRTYPGGTYALWSLFASAAGVDATRLAPSAMAALFATFLLGTVGLFLSTCYVVALRTARRWSTAARPSRVAVGLASALAVAVIVLGSVSHLLWSGWPALLAGYAALLAYVAIVLEGRRSPVPILLSTAVAGMVVAYTYPLLLPFVAAAGLGAVVHEVARAGRRAGVRWLADPWGIAALVVCAALAYKPLIEVKRAGSGSVLVFGDIEPVGWVVPAAGVLVAAWVVVAAVRRSDLLLATFVPLSAVFAAGLCWYSLVATSAVQYYPMRAVYTVLILSLLLATGAFVASAVPSTVTGISGAAVLTVFVAVTVYVGFRPLQFGGPYMGSTAYALRAIVTQDLAAATSGCGRLIVDGATAVSSGRADVAIVVAGPTSPVDLPSRWANALAYRMRDDNRSLTMDLDTLASDPAAFGQTVRDWRSAGGTGRIIVVADPTVVQSLRDAGSLPPGVELVAARCTE